jgi:hypothetical protein
VIPKYKLGSDEFYHFEAGELEADCDIDHNTVPAEDVAYWRGYLSRLDLLGEEVAKAT